MSEGAQSDNQAGVLQPGQVIRPTMGKEVAIKLALRLFGLTVTSIKELDSYDDRNYLIKVEGESTNPHIKEPSPDGYVLKITNSLDSNNSKIMASQGEMMLFLHSRGFKVPKPEKNVHGSHLSYAKISGEEVGEEGGENIVRLLTFIPGKILHQVPTTPQLFYEVGVFTSKMDTALKDFSNEDLRQRKYLWCMESVPQLPKFLYAVKDEHRRKLVEEVLQAWEERVAPVLPRLKKGFIHGDANEQNFIVNASQDDPSTYHVDALIDFGDIQHSYYLFELSIITMYMMLVAKTMDPNDVGGHIIAGYLKHMPVSDDEWNILKECVAARFVQSLVLGAYSILQDPDNQYLLVTAAKGWELLDSLWHTPKEQLIARWKSILKGYQEAHSV